MGTGKYEQTSYVLDGRSWETEYSPIAVGHLVYDTCAPVTVLTLLTTGAEVKHGDRFSELVAEAGWDYCPIKIPDGRSEAELWEIFQALGDSLREGDEVVLDPTHGFRSLPIILLSALQYYRIQKNLKLVKVYYGAYQPNEPEAPVFDLTPIIALADWTYGIKIFKDYQLSRPLGEQLEQLQITSHTDPAHAGAPYTRLQNVGKSLQELEPLLRYGLPIEAGLEAAKLARKAEEAREEISSIPPMTEPWKELTDRLRSFELPGNKKKIRLSEAELERQARLIASYFKANNVWAAFALMREWLVSAVLLHQGKSDTWLARESREPAEKYLSQRAHTQPTGDAATPLSAAETAITDVWDKVGQQRNKLAHAGMSGQKVNPASLESNIAGVGGQFTELREQLKASGYFDAAHQPAKEGDV